MIDHIGVVRGGIGLVLLGGPVYHAVLVILLWWRFGGYGGSL